MKKVIACLAVLMMLVSLCVPAMAADQDFTPSVTDKPSPDIVPIPDPDGNPAIGVLCDDEGQIIEYIYEGCLVITAVADAETSTEIPEASKTLLLDVYGKLKSGAMTIPYEKHKSTLNSSNMAIRDLFDATFLCTDHPQMLKAPGVTLKITFDLGVAANDEVYTMTYKNSEWNPIVSTKNNGDGTVTCVFEDLCPVEFSVRTGDTSTPTTGDSFDMMWVFVALACLAAIVVLTVIYRVDSKKRAAR